MSTSSKNTFIETSHDLMDVWFRGMKQWQKASAISTEEHPYEFVSEWAQKQQDFLTNIIGYDSPQELQKQAPKHFQNWLKIQSDFAQQWMKQQEGVGIQPFTEEQQKQFHEMNKSWQENYQQWEKTVVGNMQKMQQQLEDKMPTEMLSNIRGFSKTYSQFFENWNSLLHLMKTSNQLGETLKTWSKNANYTAIVDSMMGFNSTKQLQLWMTGFNKNMSNYLSDVEANPFVYGFNGSKELAGQFQGTWQQYLDLSLTLQNQLKKTLSPFNKLDNSAYSIQIEESLKNIQTDYNTFLTKSIELQQAVYQSAGAALEESAQVYQNILKGEEQPSYHAFFGTWTEMVEKHLVKLFESEAYIASQNELIMMSASIKKRFNELIVQTGNDLPFAWRSEIDELNREVKQLKKKIASLTDEEAAGE